MNFAIPGLAILFAIWSVIVTLFWMYIGWRAMRAHESLAESADQLSFSYRSKD